MKKFYVMIHVIKHDMDPNSNINYCRKIGPVTVPVQSVITSISASSLAQGSLYLVSFLGTKYYRELISSGRTIFNPVQHLNLSIEFSFIAHPYLPCTRTVGIVSRKLRFVEVGI
jgi:hypothetical protein